MASSKGLLNLGLSRLANVLLQIFLGWLFLGAITRLMRGKILYGIIAIILDPIFWIVDLITLIFSNDVTILA
ncbi:MAG TPA: hypothetical protein DDY82_01700 [Clostridiales bacterium]|nr:hypothetical protein [Clostridiales bacterium]